MSFLRNLFSDLVERRLWPVAALLVVALVAVPVLLAKPSTGEEQAPLPAPGDVVDARGPSVSLADPPGSLSRVRPGGERDPFVQQHVPPKPKQQAGLGPSTGGGTTTKGGGTTGGGGTTKGGGETFVTYKVDIRFGEAGAQDTLRNVPRLTPLPDGENPFLIFLGVLSDGKTAVFLVSADIVPAGDGKCKPSRADCETIHLKSGDTEFFDVPSGEAGIIQYQLDLVKITKEVTSSAAQAARAYARESRAGRRWLRDAIGSYSELGVLRYARGRGVLRYRRPPEQTREGEAPPREGGPGFTKQP